MITGNSNKIKSQVQASMRELDELENEASQLRDTIEEYEAARERNHTIATKRAALEGEREALKLKYTETSFEGGDAEGIHERRREIDSELSELSELEAVPVPTLDTFAIADLRYRAEHTKFASVEQLLKLVSDELESLRTTHHDRKRLAVVGLDAYTTTDDENAVRKHHRPGWKSGEELREEREARERAENIRKYGTETPDFSSTDAMTRAMWKAKEKRRRERAENAV